MAEAEAEISSVIENLDNFLIEKRTDVDGYTMDHIERVRNELRLILDFLNDKILEEGSSLKYWVSDAVEIAHDAHQFIHDTDPWRYFELSRQFKPICRAIRETRKRILRLGVEGPNSTLTSSSLGGDEYVVVGLEEDAQSLLGKSIFPFEGRGLSTICIVGMAGVGKTTLARKMYDHAAAVDRYDRRVWVSLSGELSNKEVLMRLIRQVVDSKDRSHEELSLEKMDNGSLQRMLHQHLQGKQFLIVLDNVGEIPYSRSIFKALPREGMFTFSLISNGSRFVRWFS